MSENGYIILADITGYTQYLNESELEHAQAIITSLINAMLKPLHPPIRISRVEGDAIFAYTTGQTFNQGQTLLEALEKLYFEFSRDLELNDRNTNCPCRACTNMRSLDLKMIVHYGEFGLQQLGQQTDLIGRDVNLAHRLLKNTIIEKTGVSAYLFMTQAAVEQMKMAEFSESLIPHMEQVPQLGDVSGFVYDLKPAWALERERHHVRVEPGEANLTVSFNLPVPPAVAWDYLNEPSIRALYRHYEDRPVLKKQKGRLAIGTVYHCAHGENITPETIVDWQPFDYVTIQSQGKIMGQNVGTVFTMHIEPENGSSVVTFSFRKMAAARETLASRFVAWIVMPYFRMMVPGDIAKGMEALKELIRRDQEEGVFSIDAGASSEAAQAPSL